jgi:hypothetical protein
LRVSAGTTLQEAQENSSLASKILEDEDLKPYYNIHNIPPYGKVSITRRKGMSLVGNKLSHMRKPSAYHKKVRICSSYKYHLLVTELLFTYAFHNVTFQNYFQNKLVEGQAT